MTDKQIINSCEFQSRCIQYKDMYSNKHIKCPIVDFAIACRGENKCKYKTVYEQLKAKEQECEGLKENEKSLLNVINHLQKTKNEWEEKYNDLGQDFDQLKAELEPFKDEYFKGLDNVTIAKLAKKSIRITAENCKLEQTITEIKEIAEDAKTKVFVDMEEFWKQILQKISECEVENDR